MIFLQCDEYIHKGDKTLHIMGHYVNYTTDHMHKYLTDWVEVHLYFEKVGGDLICQKALDVEDYMCNIV